MKGMATFPWYNYRTDEYDPIEGAPQDFHDYIPQCPAAQNLFNLLVEHKGKSPLEAVIHVLSAATGEKAKGGKAR